MQYNKLFDVSLVFTEYSLIWGIIIFDKDHLSVRQVYIYCQIFYRQKYIIRLQSVYRCFTFSRFFFGAFTLQTPGIEIVAQIYSKPCVIPLLESSRRKPWPSIEPSLSFGSVREISSLSLDNRARPNFKGIKRFESLQFLDPRESSGGVYVRGIRSLPPCATMHMTRLSQVHSHIHLWTALRLHFALFQNRSK